MTQWVRYYFAENDEWLHYEIDADGEVTRQVDLRGPDKTPVTAAAWDELSACTNLVEVQRYEARYGALAEVPLRPDDVAECEPMAEHEFDEIWRAARRHLA